MQMLFTIFAFALWGAEPEWRVRLEHAVALMNAGSPEAASKFADALESAERVRDGDLAKAVVSSLSARVLIQHERYREAEQVLEAALAVFARNPGQATVEHIAALNNLAFLLHQMGRTEREMGYLRLAATTAEQMQPADPLVVAPILGNLAVRYLEMGDGDQALGILRKAEPHETHPSLSRHVYRTPLLNVASELHIQRGEPKLAREKAELALRIIEQAGKGDGVELVAPLNHLARAEMELGRLSAAERHWKRGLEILRTHRSQDYPHIASLLVPLASLKALQGRIDEAFVMLREAARIAELSLRFSVLAVVQHEMGKLHARRNRHGEAEPLYRSSLKLTAEALGRSNIEYATCLSDLAYSLAALRHYTGAETVLRESIELREQLRGGASSPLVSLLDRHAELLRKLNRKQEAKGVQARARGLRAEGANTFEQTVDVLELKERD